MELQIEARRTGDIRNTRCRGWFVHPVIAINISHRSKVLKMPFTLIAFIFTEIYKDGYPKSVFKRQRKPSKYFMFLKGKSHYF